ncbi:LysR family transcriptional regulator [Leeia oryzae]|uniref:LysR family transcriptional regulator n=1 Tax=Leeia oryzae TaxID=356662 RepID=UPI0003648B45|nr:LysR family transcriptional regulator [Leeia oryzae]
MNQLQDVDLKLLRVFMTIVKCGGFSAAQAMLNMSQSAISEQMISLEARLGVRLCERGRSGFRLTEHGQATYEAAQRLLLAVETFCVDTDALKQKVSGRLYLGIIDNTITDPASPLTRATQRFVARGHHVHLDIYVGTPAELEERVLDGRLHVAIGHFPLKVPGLNYTPLYQEPDGLFCGRLNPLYQTTSALEGIYAAMKSSHIVARGFLQQSDLRQLKVKEAAANVDNVEAQAMLILSGAYIGFLPLHYARRWVDAGDLFQIAPTHFHSAWPFAAITRRGNAEALILKVFMEDLIAVVKSAPAR